MGDVREALIEAITKADANFGCRFNMTKLVGGVATHTLFMEGFDPVDFEDREDGYRLIEERRNRARTDAILAALTPPDDAAIERVARGIMAQMMATDGIANDMLDEFMRDPKADLVRDLARAALKAYRGDAS